MMTAIIFTCVGLLVGTVGGWWLGYETGNLDGDSGVRKCWPWSREERLED